MFNGFSIEQPQMGYTCPLKTVAGFVSFDEQEDTSIVDQFKSMDNHNDVLALTQSLKLGVRDIVVKQNYKYITFDRSSFNIKPVFWAQFDEEDTEEIDEMWVDVRRFEVKIRNSWCIGRFFYILLINAEHEGNIDVKTVQPFGVNLKLSKLTK